MATVDAQQRCEIIDVYNAYAECIDTKNWPMVRACFADEVVLDYGGVNPAAGDPDLPRLADDWMPVLQSVINGFDRTRHIISNFRFRARDEGIECRAYLQADHLILEEGQATAARPDQVVTVVGEYTNVFAPLDGAWKIVRSKLAMEYTTGNDALFITAAQRAAAGS